MVISDPFSKQAFCTLQQLVQMSACVYTILVGLTWFGSDLVLSIQGMAAEELISCAGCRLGQA